MRYKIYIWCKNKADYHPKHTKSHGEACWWQHQFISQLLLSQDKASLSQDRQNHGQSQILIYFATKPADLSYTAEENKTPSSTITTQSTNQKRKEIIVERPSQSSNLNTVYIKKLWNNLKTAVYRRDSHTLVDLEQSVKDECKKKKFLILKNTEYYIQHTDNTLYITHSQVAQPCKGCK